MNHRRRSRLLALGLALAAASAVAAFLAWRAAEKARAYWLESPGSRATLSHLAFSPSGEWLAGADEQKGVSIWSLRNRTFVRRVESEDKFFEAMIEIAFTGDGRLVAEGTGPTVVLRQAPGWEVSGSFTEGTPMAARALTARGSLVARSAQIAPDRRDLQVWDVSGEPRLVCHFGDAHLTPLGWTGDGTRLIVADSEGEALHVHEARTGKRLATIAGPSQPWPLAVSPTSDAIAVARSPDLSVERLAFDGTSLGTIDLQGALEADSTGATAGLHHRRISALAFSPDGRTLAATVVCTGELVDLRAPTRSWLILWDLGAGQSVAILDGRTLARSRDTSSEVQLNAVAFSPSGDWVAVAVGDRVRVIGFPDSAGRVRVDRRQARVARGRLHPVVRCARRRQARPRLL